MRVEGTLRDHQTLVRAQIEDMLSTIEVKFEETERAFLSRRQVLRQVDPSLALKRGYAIIRGEARKGEVIEIEKSDILIQAEVRNVRKK
jgi:exonuclease VII large subunit